MGPGRLEGAATKPKAVIQEAMVAVGRQPVVGSEAPSQSLPQGQRDSLALGKERCPHTKKGALTQPSRARRAVVPGSLPMAVGGAVGVRQGALSLPTRRGGTRFPGQQLTSQPASQPWPALLLPLPPAPGRAQIPPPRLWPGAQLGPGGQSYCKRPGRPQGWTLPAGPSHRHLPLPGLTS